MQSWIFDSIGPIPIISFLSAFYLASDTYGVQEGTVLWLVNVFMQRRAAATLKARTALKFQSHKRLKEGTVVPYCGVVIFVLETYATDDGIARTDARITSSTHPLN